MTSQIIFGDLAQLVRAFASHARGHGFESPSLHHNPATDRLRDFFVFKSDMVLLDKNDKYKYNYDTNKFKIVYCLCRMKGEVIMKCLQVLKDLAVCILCATPIVLYAVIFMLLA